MSSDRDTTNEDPAEEQDLTTPMLQSWWAELSVAAKVLVPTTALVLVFVTANVLPPFVF